MKRTTSSLAIGLFAVVSLGTGACNKKEVAAAPPSPESTKIFNERCSLCHGARGLGDGPAAAALNPKPRNYTDKAWQAAVTDDQLRKTIGYGGAAVGKSPSMPSSPDLDAKPEVVDGLLQIVRSFGK